MGALIWVAMGVALWHFAIFIPDRFWGGIVGSMLFAMAGSLVSGFIISGLTIPGNSDVTMLTALQAIPGAIAGIGLAYLIGVKKNLPPLDL